MLYYLTTPIVHNERALGKFTVPDAIAAELAILANPVGTTVISQEKLLKLVDDGVMPSNSGDVIFVKDYNRLILSYLKVMRNREFKIINSYETTVNIRNVAGWATTLESLGIPVRKPVNDQVFAKRNFDRTKSFGQGFEDFIIEYIKEYGLTQFNLRPCYNPARWINNKEISGGYSISDVRTFDWTKVDSSTHQYFILDGLPTKTFRVVVIAGKIVREACLATDNHFIDNSVVAENTDVIGLHPEIEPYTLKVIESMNLEIGFVDFHLINNEIRLFDIGNFEQIRNANPFDLTPLIVDFLVQKYEN